MEDFGSSIETYGRSGDRKLLGLVGMVSSLAVAVGLYAAVGFAQPVRHIQSQGSMAALLGSADGPGGAASLAPALQASGFRREG
ncbi:hypothetical protein [Muricoccus vinaceus]|uniref:Uncharacterized protein n=1 Tax=Muricoccus vinaceus TaxID=424704 RepID=A0ABV6IQS9_9PROT